MALSQPFAFAQDSRENAAFKLAINLYNDALYDLAAEQLRHFLGTYPNTPQSVDARFYLGLSQLKLKQYDDARMTFQTFALTYQDNPRAPEAWWNVGESFAAAGNYREAALAFERLKVFHPRSTSAPDALVQAGKYFKLASDLDNARRVLRVALQQYGSSKSALAARAELGQLYFEEGNLDRAESELKRIIDGDPPPDTKAQALMILGNIYQAMARTDQAQKSYEAIITNHKNSLAVQDAHLQLGKLQSASGKYFEAVENFRSALSAKNDTDSSIAREAAMSIGDAYAGLHDYTNAVMYYEKFLSSYPSDVRVPEILWKIASSSSKSKNFTKSNETASRILKSHASDALKQRAQIRLAQNAEAQNSPSKAVVFYEEFLNAYPDHPVSAEVCVRIGGLSENNLRDKRKAAAYYERAKARYPNSALVDDACISAARCYEDLEEFDRALHFYRKLVERFPASEFRQQADERIRMIETFQSKDKNAGLEKLVMLIGDVIAGQDKVGLAYRLGEIYYHDLKNYKAAADQFSNAINSGMSDSRFVDALYYRAASYEYLSWKEEKYRRKAIESYETFLHSYPLEPRSEVAALALFNLTAVSVAEARPLYATTISTYPNFPGTAAMLLRIGTLQEEADSSAGALHTYSTVVNTFEATHAAQEARFRKMQLLLKLGHADSAMSAGNGYINAYPTGLHAAEVVTTLADLAIQKNNPMRAIELYKMVLHDFAYTSHAAKAKRRLAEAYGASGKHNDAITLYTELLHQETISTMVEDRADTELLLALARTQQLAGNMQEAKKLLFQLLAQERSGEVTAQAYTSLGEIYKNEGALELATAYFRQAASITPHSAATRDVADLMFETGAYAEAIEQFTRLSQSATNDEDKQYCDRMIIVSQLRNDEIAKAANDIKTFKAKYRRADEDLATFELEKGNYFFRSRDYVNARKAFDRVADKFDETSAAPVAMYWIGKASEAENTPQEALKHLDELIEKYPTSPIIPRAYLARGNIFHHAEKWDESIKNYKRIVDDPNADPSLLQFAMNNLIETYESAGVYDAALALTRRYLDVFPESEDSFDKRIKIGILYQRLGYNDQSVVQLQTLLDEASSELEGELRYYIAEANYNKGDYKQAILDFLKIPYLVTKKGKIDWTANSLYMSGQSYEKMGRYDQALTMYQQIIDRQGIDETFKAAAKKEIDRVKLVLKGSN
ncbi:MAG: tetratricopeptide repeat protein [Ignavibacteria bacterium]|nr:tetratricopeptide repeat protein [Ignavibacteria bacterium]